MGIEKQKQTRKYNTLTSFTYRFGWNDKGNNSISKKNKQLFLVGKSYSLACQEHTQEFIVPHVEN